jgi:hypothetical protein
LRLIIGNWECVIGNGEWGMANGELVIDNWVLKNT